MTNLSRQTIGNLVDFLEARKLRDDEASLGDVMHLAEVMAESLQDFLKSLDIQIYRDFREIAGEIGGMKREISRLQAAEIKTSKVPEAGRELDAVVEATETATHQIMEAAEQIMSADTSDPAAYRDEVNTRVMEIFEACSFQDITGQRISKVVETLNFVDERVSSFIERLKLRGVEAEDREETEAEKRQRELILHGPQHKGEGVSQDDIDQMLSDGGDDEEGDETQDAIDKLFP